MRRALILAVVVGASLSCESLEPLPDGGTRRDGGTEPRPPPCLEVTPSSIDFGEVEQPLNGFQRVELINRTNRTLFVHALPRTGPFFISPLDGADVSMPANTRRTVEVQFATQDARLHLGTIELTAGFECNASISVRGLGSGTVGLEPRRVDYGFMMPGEAKTLEVRITNTRRTVVTVNALELRELSALGPAFSANLPSVPFEIPPLSSTAVPITATPPTDLTFDAQLLIATQFGVVTAELRVTGGVPVAQVSPSAIDIPLATFEPGHRGAPSFVERRVMLRNIGTLGRSPASALSLVPPLMVVEQVDGGPGDEVTSQFPPELFFGLGISRGQQMELRLRVTPSSTGRRDYKVRLLTNDPVAPEQVIDVSVNAVTLGFCAMRVEPERDLQMQPTPEGRSRGTVSFINVGSNRCVVDDVGFTLMSSPEYSILDPAPQYVVEPGVTRTITLDGPRSFMLVDGTLKFHVLNRDSDGRFIMLHAPP